MMFVSGKNEKMPQMIDTLNPDKDVTPEEAMILAGSIYGGCMVNVSLDIYVQKDMQGIRAPSQI
jgi:hypothetical protein